MTCPQNSAFWGQRNDLRERDCCRSEDDGWGGVQGKDRRAMGLKIGDQTAELIKSWKERANGERRELNNGINTSDGPVPFSAGLHATATSI